MFNQSMDWCPTCKTYYQIGYGHGCTGVPVAQNAYPTNSQTDPLYLWQEIGHLKQRLDELEKKK